MPANHGARLNLVDGLHVAEGGRRGCFIGLILVPFTVTMGRKPSITQIAQATLRALTADKNDLRITAGIF